VRLSKHKNRRNNKHPIRNPAQIIGHDAVAKFRQLVGIAKLNVLASANFGHWDQPHLLEARLNSVN
jgi:hypothetical protein